MIDGRKCCETAEQKCLRLFNIDFPGYFKQCMDQKMTMAEMYSKLSITKGNFRRLMQKHYLTMLEPSTISRGSQYSKTPSFKAKLINSTNVLYRKW